ncbi:hypothetical protein K435DRAFT_422736 [Dendrothele bispora CBS 962.96]|uniref:Uncharacterized protein n=1 Tax=Dendrothele bispora (strain CBS 962.96) TaxID=1314807 RepID=A0A4S8MEN4_DENBC|nr:hypothetical protein K435DRAFT_422736 [Dendrothele bispora CBS 962.96]
MGHDPLGLQIPHLLARNLSTGDLSTRTPPVAADSVISGISYLDTSNNKHAKENEKENAKKEKLREKLKKKMLLPHLLTRPKTSKSAEFANIIPYNPCFGSPTTKMPTSTQKTPIKDKSPRTETVQPRNTQLGDTLTERSFLLPLSTHPSPSSSIVSDGRYGDSSDADSTDVYSSRSSQPDWDACSEITSIHSASLSLHPARYDRLSSTVSPTPTPHRRPQHVVVSLSKSVNNPNTVHVLSNTNDLTSNSQTFQTPLLEPGSSISTCTFSSPRESVVVNATSSTKTISYPGSSAVASYSSKVSPSAMLLSSPSKVDELYDIQEMDYEGEEFQLDISPGTPLGDTEDQIQQQQQEQEQGQERERGRAREQELFGRNSKKKWSFLKANSTMRMLSPLSPLLLSQTPRAKKVLVVVTVPVHNVVPNVHPTVEALSRHPLPLRAFLPYPLMIWVK